MPHIQNLRKKLYSESTVIYCNLILSFISVEAGEFYDAVPLLEAARCYRESETDLKSHITELKNDDERQVLDIERDHPLLQCIRLLKQKRLNLTQSPDISFVGEDGIDAEGLTREFLSLLLCSIREGENKIRLF